MIVRSVGVALFTVLATGPGYAAAPTQAQKAEFHAICMRISGDEQLCTCKADAAMELIDERFMGVVIASMNGGSPAPSDFEAYNSYVASSNRICKPNY